MTMNENDGQICCASYRVGDMMVNARLLTRQSGLQMHYYIEMWHADERAEYELGSDFMRARELFLDAVFGGVTVCTLQDVIEDRMRTHV